ncbi:hypothetical protein FDB55_06115 [Clostridium botulinum]|uniref:Uncharacterized protein n=1 Tax=Clostridium botulinum TaxID=1491 RepID=A0A0C2S7M7_CLOBO|nr:MULTISPECIES: hypothetical protein [Clostridium]ACD52071.1 conserved hypothetical protein [Clostridium botulinum E3 str. Alaska E43]AJF28853.1 hypothetical protein ST13_03945 [Clostridium botulinum]AJF31914.1 hypothetical protein ST12_03945 [Clostridium botulinum]KAI3345944.1 hypothetical protein CIT18_15115 [Clostridium botulinum]KIL09067.1 hypothetical protein SR42_08860 [Clostridium botulinum]
MIPLILITIGIILIVHNYNKVNKGTTSFEFTLNEEKENLNDYKLELGILRRDIGESLTELQQEIKTIKMSMNIVNDIEKEYDNIIDRNIEKLEFDAEEEVSTKEEINIIDDINLDKVNIEKVVAKEQSGYEKTSMGVISEINFKNKEVFNNIIEDSEFVNQSTDKNNEVPNEVSKKQRITDLIKQNSTDEEICKALSVSKGEVLLVRNLFKS